MNSDNEKVEQNVMKEILPPSTLHERTKVAPRLNGPITSSTSTPAPFVKAILFGGTETKTKNLIAVDKY